MSSFMGMKYVVPIDIESERIAFVGSTLSLRRQIVEPDAQRWLVRVGLQAAHGSNAGALVAHRFAQGRRGIFEIAMPQVPGVIVPSGASARLAAAAAAGTTRLRLSIGGAIGDVGAGRFVRIGASPKIYQVKAPLHSAAVAHEINADIFPPLVAPAGAGSAVDFTPSLRARYQPAALARITWQDGRLTRLVLDLEEAL